MMLNTHCGLPRKLSEDRSNRITVASYTYNHLNQRISKTTPDSTTHYHHDAQGRLWSETDGQGNTIRDYIWMGEMPVAMVDYPEGIERVTYLHADHLNTPRYGTNQAGDVVWQWQSDAFGNGLPNEDVDGDGLSVQVNLRFPGQYYDAESGLHYNWNRYYDPSIGRYITSDPIGLAGGLNTYVYVGGSPVNYADPLGLRKVGGRGGDPLLAGTADPVFGVFGCLFGCLSYHEGDAEAQAGMGATIGGGIEICQRLPQLSIAQECEAESKKNNNCGLYDPNCDNSIPPPDIPIPTDMGFFIGASIKKDGRFCTKVGAFGSLPLTPYLELGDLSE